ncbi:MAG: SurA N-terminal domain-containing protein [Deltaproteobacteria bacterium]|nr:SurA N-terminal domain-containing protein [Deltaproteobacteria bacterium]
MLQILRNKAQSIVIQAMVLIIALVFIFWGVGTKMMNSRDAAITINNEEITFQEFQRSYDQAITGYRRQFGDAISDEILKGLGVKQQVVNQLIQTALLRQGANAMGIMATPVEIQTAIQKMPQFQQEGSFNMNTYQAILSANRLTPHKFEASIGHDLLGEKVITSINNFATTASGTEINEMYKRDQETVRVKVVKVTPALFNDQIVVNPQDLAAWFETEKNTYKTEKKIKLNYLSFPYKAQIDKVTISDEQVLAQYEKEKAAYQVPEKRHARHILLKTEENASPEKQAEQRKKAEEILIKARAGEDFSKLAATYSEDPSKAKGGDLGTFAKGKMIKEFDDAVFSMQPNDISDIIQTRFGYHIIKLDKIMPATTQPIEEVRAAIIAKLQSEQARPATFQMANEAYEGIIAAGSLPAYAEKHAEKAVVTTDFFSRTAPPATLDHDPKFMDTIFALKQGELSSLIETPSGYFILFAEAIQEPAPPKLEEVKELVIKDYKLAKARKMAKETATAILTKVQGGADFEKTASEAKLQAKKSGPLSKNNATPDPVLPPSLLDQALRLSAKNPFPKEALAVGDDLYILQFLERKLPEAASLDAATRKEYTTTLIKQKQDQLLSSWLKQQEKNSKISINKNILK